jgi:hypothetical protein
MLTQNAELREDRVWNWTLPAWVVRLPNGRAMNVCPSAGACAALCYARNGTYTFPAVAEAHLRNLLAVTYHLDRWTPAMLNELRHRRYRPTGRRRLALLPRAHLHPHVSWLLDAGAAAVRIHDSGDFFSATYLHAWLTIARHSPHALFYAYTKEVALLEAETGAAPPNFLWVYSLGGRQDHLIDRDTMRHADVFPDRRAIAAAGYYSQHPHDLLAVVAPSLRIGIPANNIPRFNRELDGRTFAQAQADRHHAEPELAR